jgi:hypothetical protein
MSLEEIFGKIYAGKIWGEGSENSPLSGAGSTVYSSKEFVEYVSGFIAREKIKSVFDLGHGDWQMWGTYRFLDVDYTGFDVVQELSRDLALRFGNKTTRFKFQSGLEAFPIAELMICKDVLQHLSNEKVLSILSQVKDFKYVIIANDYYIRDKEHKLLQFILYPLRALRFYFLFGTKNLYRRNRNNRDILTGDCRPIDLGEGVFKNALSGYTEIDSFKYSYSSDNKLCKKVYLFKKF